MVGSLVGGAVWFGALARPTRVEAQSQTTPLSYTAGQADQGQAAYVEHCASCHGQNLEKQLSVFAVNASSASATPVRAAGPCGACGDPRGPGSCSMN